jgi:hypothetical protein
MNDVYISHYLKTARAFHSWIPGLYLSYLIHIGYVQAESAVLENGTTVEQVIKVRNVSIYI